MVVGKDKHFSYKNQKKEHKPNMVQSGLLSTKLVSCDLIRTPKHCSKALFVSSVSDLYIRVL